MASASFVSSASDFTTASTTTIAVTIPSVSASQLILVSIQARNNNSPSFTPPAGFTNLGLSASDGSTGMKGEIFYKVADGTESSPCTFTLSGSAQTVTATLIYSNINTSCPFDVYASASSGGASASTIFPTVTTTAASEMLVYFSGIVGQPNITNGAGLTEREDMETTGTNNAGGWAGDELQESAGLSTQRSNELGSAQRNVNFTIALQTAASDGGAAVEGQPTWARYILNPFRSVNLPAWRP